MPHQPFRLYGGTYYVGTAAISAVLITSPQGHVLIDGAIADSVPQIAANIRALGFRVEDIKLILTSHVHLDHVGGLAELQRLSGAEVKASSWSADVLKSGGVGKGDPQYGTVPPIAPVNNVSAIADGAVLKVGPIAIQAHFTPGHTPGGTTWTWDDCEQVKCLHIVDADSLNAVSSPDFLFTRNTTYRDAVADFQKSFAVLSGLPCDIFLSDHPEFSDLWPRLAKREGGAPDALIDTTACQRYAATARMNFDKRIAAEKAK